MNDSAENKWLTRHSDTIEKKIKSANPDAGKLTVLAQTFVSNHELGEFSYPYVFCMSKVKDDLSQWRGYANDGTGVAIEFDFNRSRIPKLNLTDMRFDVPELVFGEILYETIDQQRILENLPDDLFVIDSSGELPELKELKRSEMVKLLAWFFKNKAFRSEHEYRLIYNPHNSNRMAKFKFPIKRPHKNEVQQGFHLSNNNLVQHYSLNIDKLLDQQLITCIYLGPKCKLTESVVTKFLQNYGIENVSIKKSKATYR